MTNSSLTVLLGSAFCAAVENVLLKIGFLNKERQFELFNPPVLVGFVLYMVLAWCSGLSPFVLH
jgi:hypothetical protein